MTFVPEAWGRVFDSAYLLYCLYYKCNCIFLFFLAFWEVEVVPIINIYFFYFALLNDQSPRDIESSKGLFCLFWCSLVVFVGKWR